MFNSKTVPKYVAREIFSYLDFAKLNIRRIDSDKDIKFTNKFLYNAYHIVRNTKSINYCKKYFGFEPPLEKATLILKICGFIHSKGEMRFSKANKKDLAQSADKILKEHLPEPWAYYLLSLLHLEIIKPCEDKLGAEYCLAAAGFGFAPALCLLAKFFKDGLYEFNKNPTMMIKLLNEASDKNNATAKRMLGFEYLQQGNKEEALKYLIDAANANDAPSFLILAKSYRDGLCGIDQNTDQSIQYFKKAINLGSSPAAEELSDSFYSGKGCIPEDSKKGKEFLILYYEIESQRDNGIAALKLARIYSKDGSKIKAIKSYKEALKLLVSAAEKGSLDEQSELRGCKLDGAWLLIQGEFRLGKNYITASSKFSVSSSSSNTFFDIPYIGL